MSKKPLPNPVIDAIRGRGPLSHSTLYWWMWDHYDDIDMSKTGRPDWVTATREFSNMGFKGREGAPLNKENVRKTWSRVVRDRKKLEASAKQEPATPAPVAKSSVRMLPVTNLKPSPTKPEALPSGVEEQIADVRKRMKPDWNPDKGR